MIKTIVKNTETLKKFIPELTNTKEFHVIKPHLFYIEENVIKSIIGKALLDKLRNNTEEEPEDKLLFAQIATSFGAAFELSKTGDVHFTSMGIQSLETDNAKGIYDYQKRHLMKSYSDKMDSAIDSFLEVLEKNPPSEWPAELRTENKKSILPNAKEFSKYCNIFGSRRTYLALKPIIKENERILFKKLLGEDLYEEIFKTLTGEGSGEKNEKRIKAEKELIKEHLAPALAHSTIADALDLVSIQMFADAYTFSSFLGISEKHKASDISEKDARKKRHKERAKVFLESTSEYIKENAELFEIETDIPTTFENDIDKNHFVAPM